MINLKSLNEEQKKAEKQTDGPIMIVAVAGSGFRGRCCARGHREENCGSRAGVRGE